MMRWTTCVGAALGLALAATAGAAETSPPPFKDFTFKRVGVPSKSTRKRITVQVEPVVDAPVADADASDAKPKAPVNTAYDWFWEEIAPEKSASGPGRLDGALTHLQTKGQVPTPRLDALRQTVERFQSDILLATIGTQVSPALVLSVISTESSGNPDALSSAGAQGLMQLMPATAERFEVTDALDPAQNIRGGVAYLDWLMKKFDGDPILVLAAYNAGEGAVDSHEGVPPYKETRGYVPKVLAAWSVARSLCASPPELISDGCAFNLQGG